MYKVPHLKSHLVHFRNNHRAETASGKDILLIFWPGLIVFNPKMTIFIRINREIKK